MSSAFRLEGGLPLSSAPLTLEGGAAAGAGQGDEEEEEEEAEAQGERRLEREKQPPQQDARSQAQTGEQEAANSAGQSNRAAVTTIAAVGVEEDDLTNGDNRWAQVAARKPIETAATAASSLADHAPFCGSLEERPVKMRFVFEWTLAEDELIRTSFQRLGGQWRMIAAQLPGRSDDAVRTRWSRLQESTRPPVVRDPTTSGEKSLAEKEERVPERTAWTRVEDDIIVQSVAELGHKWGQIGRRRLPGRHYDTLDAVRLSANATATAHPPPSFELRAHSVSPLHLMAQNGACHP